MHFHYQILKVLCWNRKISDGSGYFLKRAPWFKPNYLKPGSNTRIIPHFLYPLSNIKSCLLLPKTGQKGRSLVYNQGKFSNSGTIIVFIHSNKFFIVGFSLNPATWLVENNEDNSKCIRNYSRNGVVVDLHPI